MIYASVLADLQKARKRIYISTWGLEDDFLIRRGPGQDLTLAEFCKGALAAHPQLQIYILVWDWVGWAQRGLRIIGGGTWGRYLFDQLPLPTREAFGGRLAPDIAGRLHIALQANSRPDPFGTHHQKMILADLEGDASRPTTSRHGNASLHCVGLNLMNIYWDSRTHPRPPRSTPDTRHARQHDLGLRAQGPMIAQFEDEFDRRWLAATGEVLPPRQFACSPQGNTRALGLIHREQTADDVPAKEWYLERIASARDLIYLENQYFDDRDITRALYSAYLDAEARGVELPIAIVLPWLERLLPVPDWGPVLKMLPLLERLLPFTPWDPLTWWTHYNIINLRVRTAKRVKMKGRPLLVRPRGGWPQVREAVDPDRFLRSIARDLRPGSGVPVLAALLRLLFASNPFKVRVGSRWVEWRKVVWIEGGIEIYRMMAGARDWPPVPVYVHSKLGIIDDAYVLGSSNIARQSFVADSEADVAVEGRPEVDRLTRLLWPVLVGDQQKTPECGREWLSEFKRTATSNAVDMKRAARGRVARPPRGLLLPWRPLEY
jgi:phosphatidylserine/phosphatidylglycerophosphate/cardiolipin synthase-like enzyme